MAKLCDLCSLASQASREKKRVQLIQSECSYYHYLCDGLDDRGWGCGYRSLQSLCSWVVKKGKCTQGATPPGPTSPSGSQGGATPPGPAVSSVPTIPEIQSCLVAIGDKPSSFLGSREWIGCYEASIVLDQLYGVPCRILHVPSGSEVGDKMDVLNQHFIAAGSPVMIGGDRDQASKTLIGTSWEQDQPQFLLADPHYQGESDASVVLTEGYVSWNSIKLFQSDSFYNFCLPISPTI